MLPIASEKSVQLKIINPEKPKLPLETDTWINLG
jgi:hypothetical protein